MTEFRKVVQCPNCRFANRLGEKRCLICKAELAQTASPELAPPPAPSPASNRGPAAASNAAAAARASSAPAKQPATPGVIRKLVDPTKLGKDVTSQTRRPDQLTSMRPAVEESLLSPKGNGAAAHKEEEEPPPKPLTRRVAKPGVVVEAVAWLWCDPLPPIPLVVGKQVIVGRADTCDLVLPHKEVSRAHAVFKISGKQITLEDQGSSNGCYLNGKRSANGIVKVGDMIQIGPYEIELRATGEDGSHDKAGDTKSLELTSINSSGPGASMTGKLSEVPLVEILQTIEFNAKTCTLAISDGKLKGQVVFATGRPVTATFGGERDMAAMRAMLALKDGRFVLSNEIEPVEQTMNTTVTALLLDAARGQDEADSADAAAAASAAELAELAEADPVASEPASVEAYESNSYQLNPDLAKTAEAESGSGSGEAPGDAPTADAAPPTSGE